MRSSGMPAPVRCCPAAVTSHCTHGSVEPYPSNSHAERTRSRGGRDVEATFDMDVHVAFDGSGVALITIDTEREYTLDLDTGEVAKQ